MTFLFPSLLSSLFVLLFSLLRLFRIRDKREERKATVAGKHSVVARKNAAQTASFYMNIHSFDKSPRRLFLLALSHTQRKNAFSLALPGLIC